MNCFNSPTTPEQILGNRFSGKSFFDPNQYKAALERCEAANKSCEIHIEMFNEFAEILENFKKSLTKWRTENEKKIYHSREFGTNKDSWLNTVRTMETIGDRPNALAKQIRENVVNKMKSYRENEFGRTLIHSKKYKTFERSFSKAQKPWVELIDDINEKWSQIAEIQSELDKARRAAKYCDEDVGAEQEKKDAAKRSLEKREEKMRKSREQYKSLLEKGKTQRESYKKSMIDALETTHQFERERLKEFLISFQQLQNLITTTYPNDTVLADSFEKAISKHKIEEDIDYWNRNYGSKNELPWGVFQEIKD